MKTYLYLSTAIISVSLATSGEAWAQCVSTQDCTALGYTETSCPNGGVKCPFGNKWFCGADSTTICQQEGFTQTCTGSEQCGLGEACANLYKQCGNSTTHKYACSGTGYSGGSGSACGGKYTACTCASGYTWDAASGACISDCVIGALYYSDGTCSQDKLSSKMLLGVVIYEKSASQNGWIMTVKPIQTNIAWDTGSNYSTGITDKAVSASCTNTQKLVALGSRFAAANAANNYKPTGTPSGKKWCLPSYDLLNNLNNSTNFAKVNAGITTAGGTILGNVYNSGSYYYERVWSSSEYDYSYAWYFHARTSGSFDMYSLNKTNHTYRYSVRPVLAF